MGLHDLARAGGNGESEMEMQLYDGRDVLVATVRAAVKGWRVLAAADVGGA